MTIFQIILVGLGAFVIIVLGLFVYFISFFRKVEQGKALIVNTMRREPLVTFTGRAVIPVIHKAEVMDISLKTIEIDRRGREGLICRDNIRADIKVAFFVRVNKTTEDVLRVAQAIGCKRASDPLTLEELFNAKFSEALKTVGKQLDFEDLYKERDSFRDKIIEVIGKDLNGYVLEDAAIDYLEQTPLEHLDSSNILDAQGIRKITELTAHQHVLTNEAQRDEQMRIKQKDVQARETILELERQEEDATAKQRREVENVRMREQAEIDSVQAQERFKAETARIQTDERLAVAEENKNREAQVAEKNRERTVAIETERVERARALEQIEREREVELSDIAKEKALEVERKAIADVVRERIAVDKTVAEEEERIKELRVVAEAERLRRAAVITAEGAAQEKLVAEIKAAEAAEEAARFLAREEVVRAEANLEASEKEAQAKIRLAEGRQAEAAAEGLAKARVQEAQALAEEKTGMAQVRVQEATADVVEKTGLAEAMVDKEKLLALAVGEKERGVAEAAATRAKMSAEAQGLVEKFDAMQSMGEEGRQYEELRLKLDIMRAIQLAQIAAGERVAQAQAGVLGEAVKSADIDIVGGDGQFFDRMVNAVSLGKAVDGFAGTDTARKVFGNYLDGDGNLPADLKEVLGSLSSGDVQNLTLSAFLARLMASGDDGLRSKIEGVISAISSGGSGGDGQ